MKVDIHLHLLITDLVASPLKGKVMAYSFDYNLFMACLLRIIVTEALQFIEDLLP